RRRPPAPVRRETWCDTPVIAVRGGRPAVPFRRRHAVGLVAGLAFAAFAMFPTAGHASTDLTDPGWSITPVTPMTTLTDGQTVRINVKARSAVPIFDLTVRQCLAGVTFSGPDDWQFANGKCPGSPVSSSGDLLVHKSSSG